MRRVSSVPPPAPAAPGRPGDVLATPVAAALVLVAVVFTPLPARAADPDPVRAKPAVKKAHPAPAKPSAPAADATDPPAGPETLRALVQVAKAAKDEKPVTSFIDRHRGELVVTPAEIEPSVDLYLSLAAEMTTAGMPAAANAFFSLAPDSDVMIEDLRVRIAHPAGIEPARLARFQAALARLEEQRRHDATPDVTRLAGKAQLLEQAGDLRGACACYELLEKFYARSPQREEHLFQLARTAMLSGQMLLADRSSAAFRSAFPQSRRGAELRRTLLTALFQTGEYAACVKAAAAQLAGAVPGSREHDASLYFIAASDYYLGRTSEAGPLIDQQVEKYPQSEFRQPALWFQAAVRSQQGKRSEAAALLDAFLAAYPEPARNAYLPSALLERALCHVAEKQWPQALEKLDRLAAVAAGDRETADAAANLRGQVLVALGRSREATEAYRSGLKLARERGHAPAAAEALVQLVALLSAEGKERPAADREALTLVDLYWKEYAAGSSKEVARRFPIAQAELLARAGRSSEALERLSGVISSADCGAADRSDAAWLYAQLALRGGQTPEALKEKLLHFPGLLDADRKAQALLRGILVMALDDPARRRQAGWNGRVDPLLAAIHQELKSRFAPEDFPTPLLMRTGDFLRTTSSAPRQALPYYEEVLHRPDEGLRGRALLGKAAVLAQGTEAEKNEARQMLEQGREDFARLAPAEQAAWQQVQSLTGRPTDQPRLR